MSAPSQLVVQANAGALHRVRLGCVVLQPHHQANIRSGYRILATAGAVDAFEQLLTSHLTRGGLLSSKTQGFDSSFGLLYVHGLKPGARMTPCWSR